MKLNEIKQLTSVMMDLKEGVIPVHITMTLDDVVKAGQITNAVQTFVMAGLMDMFKDGGPYRWPREINYYNASTVGANSDMVEAVKGLQPSEQVEVAEWLQQRLTSIADYESQPDCETPARLWLMTLVKKKFTD